MAKLVTDALLKKSVEDILTELVNSTYEFTEYTTEEVGNLVELDPTQVAELSAVISDTQVAKNKVFSSFHTKELLQQSVIESNQYTDDLVANLSNIKLDIVDTLPDSTTVDKSTIYILKDSSGGTNNTLNVWSNTTSAFVEVGKLSVNMDNYYTKSEVDAELAKKANADEVLKPDAIVADLTTTSGTTVLSSAGLQTELDKKFDKSGILSSISATPSDEKVLSEKALKTELDKKIDKTAISTSISGTPSDEKVPSEKAVYENTFMFKNVANIDNTDGSWIAQFIRPTSDKGTFPSESSDWYKVEQIKARDFIHQICTLHDSSNLRSTYIRGAWCNATLIENAKWSSWQKVLTDTDITNTINSSSTNTQVASAKAVYSALSSNLKDAKIMYYDFGGTFSHSDLGVDHTNTLTEIARAFGNYTTNTYGKQQYAILEFATNNNSSVFNQSLPTNCQSCIGTIKYMPWQQTNRIQVIITNLFTGDSYIGSLNNSNTDDIIFKKICTTSVADVPRTELDMPTLTEGKFENAFSGNISNYSVKNGVCTLTLTVKCVTPISNLDTTIGSKILPKSANGIVYAFGFDRNMSASTNPIMVQVDGNGNLLFGGGTAGGNYRLTFSYPVAE